ncbi:hypothetical protein ACLKA6_019397 [Drosophila palustris]
MISGPLKDTRHPTRPTGVSGVKGKPKSSRGAKKAQLVEIREFRAHQTVDTEVAQERLPHPPPESAPPSQLILETGGQIVNSPQCECGLSSSQTVS